MSNTKRRRRRLSIDPRKFWKVFEEMGWSLQGHVDHVYDTFRFRDGRAPELVWRNDKRPAVQQSLMDWRADLGARGKTDWKGFLADHRKLLKVLAQVPSMGSLGKRDVDSVVRVVEKLEQYKDTLGRKLVFGSKAAHFHFPGAVPVISSEVMAGLKVLEHDLGEEIAEELGADGRLFSFMTPDEARASYRNYVALGNAYMRGVDSRTFLGRRCSADYDLHAKIFEWFVIGCRR